MPSAVKHRRIVIDDNSVRLDFEAHPLSRLNRDRHIPLIKSPIGDLEVLRRPRTAPEQIGADLVPREAADGESSPAAVARKADRLAVPAAAAVGANHRGQ